MFKRDSCSFSYDELVHGDLHGGQRRKGRSSSPAPSSKAKTDEGREKSSKTSGNRDQTKGAKVHADTKNCKNPSCKFWLRPVCRNCKSEFGCEFGRTCFHRHVEADEKPNKKSKIGRAKGSVALVKESTQLGCISRFLYEKVSFYVKKDKWYQNHADKFSKGRWHHMKNRKSVNLMSVVSARLILRRGHKRKPCTKNDAPAEQHGLGETYLQAQECG